MPYSIEKRDDKYVVVNDDNGKEMGEHDDRESAARQIAAIEANKDVAPPRKKMVIRPSQQEAGYVTLTSTNGQACSNCRWFSKDGGGYCHLIENYPLDVLPNGHCNRWESLPGAIAERAGMVETMEADEPDEIEAVEVETVMMDDYDDKQTTEPDNPGILKRIANLFTRSKAQSSGFKAYGDHWFARWTNTFEDREGEFFSAKAIDDYIDRVDTGVTPLPELWLYHVPGSKIGQAHMVGRVGHFVIALGSFDSTPTGQAAKAYFNKQAGDNAMSHGFTYDPNEFDGEVYHQFNTFELTVLPRKVAANPYTTFDEVKSMKLTDEKKAFLQRVLGEAADSVIAETEQASKIIADMGVNFKDFASLHSGEETEAVKEAADSAEKNVETMVADLIADQFETVQASAAAVKAVETLETKLTDALQQIADRLDAVEAENKTLRAELALTPRAASTADETVVEDAGLKAIAESKEETEHGFDPFPGVK